jgi:hypothetical protein
VSIAIVFLYAISCSNMKFPLSSAVVCSSIASALSVSLDPPHRLHHGPNDVLTAVGANSMTSFGKSVFLYLTY